MYRMDRRAAKAVPMSVGQAFIQTRLSTAAIGCMNASSDQLTPKIESDRSTPTALIGFH
jgi:hypothetical protein